MACGSVAQSESAISLASLNLTRCDLTPGASSEKEDSSRKSLYVDVHEAILFLQKEHEQVLRGLHQQVKELQERCEDLQFEAHLKHLTSSEEDTLRNKVAELSGALRERNQQLALADQRLEQQRRALQEERDQFRWKELRLQQQIDAGDQRTADLKAEVSRLRAQVHDLKVFSSALRTSSSGSPAARLASRGPAASAKPSAGLQRASHESLDALGPRSLGSEEGDVGMWREARLGGKFKGPPRPQSGSLPPIGAPAGASRPSSSLSTVFPLPPIPRDKGGGGRPHVRRQLRLLSAPSLDLSPRQPP